MWWSSERLAECLSGERERGKRRGKEDSEEEGELVSSKRVSLLPFTRLRIPQTLRDQYSDTLDYSTHSTTALQPPAVYRTIIDDVITQIRPEFDQIGVEEAVLQELLRLWELKLAQSRAADFSHDERMGPVARQFLPLPHAEAVVKDEPKDAKKGKNGDAKPKKEGDDAAADEDAINSDLDDDDELDDEDDAEGVEQGGDLVIALYEKVQRVKNKWKVTLKDGLVSVNGKEYLFAKCNGEFEW